MDNLLAARPLSSCTSGRAERSVSTIVKVDALTAACPHSLESSGRSDERSVSTNEKVDALTAACTHDSERVDALSAECPLL